MLALRIFVSCYDVSLPPAFPLLLELTTLWTPVQNSKAREDISNSKMLSKLEICNWQIKFLHAVIMSRLAQGWSKGAFAFVSYATFVGLLVLHLTECGGKERRCLGEHISIKHRWPIQYAWPILKLIAFLFRVHNHIYFRNQLCAFPNRQGDKQRHCFRGVSPGPWAVAHH